jgi:peptide methionine sulfoxide reductase MsrA
MRQTLPFHVAEDCHQQYLAKNPTSYCRLDGTGVSCPVQAMERMAINASSSTAHSHSQF